MYNTSSTYKEAVREAGRQFVPHLSITLEDGSRLTLGTGDIMQGGFTVEDGVSAPNSFQIGCACMRQLTVVLNNQTGKFAGKDFNGATLTASVGLVLPDGVEENIPQGTFTVDEATDNGATITLTALDDMDKLDRLYTESTLQYPATLAQILRDCCAVCGVALQTQSFLNDDYVVTTRPDDTNLTFRQMVSYIAQLAGCWAVIGHNNRLELGWYDFERFVVEDGLDGNTDTADGNTDSYDGGIFKVSTYGEGSKTVLRPAELDQLQSATIANTDITVTGVQVVPANDDDTAYLAGKEGYVLSIEGNPLVQGNCEALAWSVWSKIAPIVIRPCNVSSRADPSWEAGDVAYVTDRKGVKHRTIISNRTYAIGGWEKISADAETASRKQSSYSNTSHIVQAARKETAKKIAAYDLQVKYLNDLMSLSMGFYRTVVTSDDGSSVAYLHDKPLLEESQTIWKNTVDGFAVSTDGGVTYTAGMDSSGNAVVNVLSAKGINADWIKTGILESANGESTINMDDGTFNLGGGKFVFSSGERLSLEGDISCYQGENGIEIKAYENDYSPVILIKCGTRYPESQIRSDNTGALLLLAGTMLIVEAPLGAQFRDTNVTIGGTLNVAGNIYSNGIQVTSDRDKKTDIQPAECDALSKLHDLKFYSYSLLGDKKQTDSARTMQKNHVSIGIMHDEAPEEIRTHDATDSKSIDLYAYVNLLAKAVQELTAKVETLESQLQGKE